MNSMVPFSPVMRAAGADGARIDLLMDVMRDRVTAREFDGSYKMPKSHIEAVLHAAAQAPSGANAQPWHYLVVTNPHTKRLIADMVVADHEKQGRASGRFHRIDYNAMGHAPGFIVVLLDPRMTWAFPGMMDGSELDQRYHAHSERVLLQSVAASEMAAHLAAAALGYQSWWVSALGLDEAGTAIARELGVPGDLRIVDFLLFGPSLLPPSRRWKREVSEISSWDKFDMANFRSVAQIDAWVGDVKERAMDAGEAPALPRR
jgi:nitroreductase